MYTITQLAKKFSLSRTAILYYDSIDLLKPQKRTNTNYRIYDDVSVQRLKRICELRETGLSLDVIKKIISKKSNKQSHALEERLEDINKEIKYLRKQQQVILSILNQKDINKKTRMVTKEQWINFLKEAGLDEDGRIKWHMAFEKSSPECHQDFLESIGLSDTEIKKIRNLSK